jgi:outer membrane biosynthesis protein TonB
MALSRNTQYILCGVVATYIVFFTRPAPSMVVSLLASPLAQIVALALVVYVGSVQSLSVALLLAIALVLSIPAREYMTTQDEKKKLEKKAEEQKPDEKNPLPGSKVKEDKRSEPASAIHSVKPAESEKKETFANARDETLDGHPF